MKIKIARQEANISQGNLADKLKVHQVSLSRWENDAVIPGLDDIKKISEILNKPVSYFLEDSPASAPKEPTPEIHSLDMLQLTVLAGIPAGLPEYCDNDIESHIIIPRYMYPGARIAVYCKSDSMEPEIMNGDICIIRFETEPIDNKIMLCQIPGEGWTIKRIKKLKDSIELVPSNPKHKPLKPKHVRVVGQVLGTCKKFT